MSDAMHWTARQCLVEQQSLWLLQQYWVAQMGKGVLGFVIDDNDDDDDGSDDGAVVFVAIVCGAVVPVTAAVISTRSIVAEVAVLDADGAEGEEIQ